MKQQELAREIGFLVHVIETDQSVLRSPTSTADKQQLRLVIDQRKARLSELQAQLDAMPLD